MNDQEKVNEVFNECYRRMFKQSEPSGDFEKIVSSGEGRMPNFFMGYYLSDENQDKIMEEVFTELKVKKYRQGGIRSGIILGSAPSSNKESTMKHRKDYDKKLKDFLKQRKVNQRSNEK